MISTRYFKTIENMLERGYFRTKQEYQKAKKWVSEGVIPSWLEKDIIEYEESEEKNANTCKKQNGESPDQKGV